MAWTKSGTTYTTDGSQADVNSAIADATPGDTVLIPAGNFTYGTANTYLSVSKAIKLVGAGEDQTFITIAPDAPSNQNCTIRIYAAATVKNFAVICSSNYSRPLFEVSGSATNFVIRNITYNTARSATSSYFAITGAGSSGVIATCTISGGGGTNELIFGRGPTDAWQTNDSIGGAANIFIEDCVFHGSGYVCDANSNARFVVRGCTINGEMKIDGHGKSSNTPPRGVRNMEIYRNRWTAVGTGGAWVSIEFRGGTGHIWNNTVDDNTNVVRGNMQLKEYGAVQALPNFGGIYQTPTYYPVDDQVGVGKDPKVGGSAPVYLWGNTKGGSAANLFWTAIPADAITQYQTETGNPAATYTMQDIIKSDRDYFNQVTSFDGSSGVGVGTKAQMLAITPSKTGVGFWVTDEGDWDAYHEGYDGQLYTWNGSAWALKYVPYSYPHPLRGEFDPVAPTITRNPQGQGAVVGTTVVLSATAAGYPPPTYQWRKGGTPIEGATSSTLTLVNVQVADSGVYDVVATNDSGSATSATATLTVSSPPVGPTSLSVTSVDFDRVALAWSDQSTTETGFKIERSTNNVSWVQVATVGANTETYEDTALNPSTTYYYRVCAYNDVGNSSYTNTVNAATGSPPRLGSGNQVSIGMVGWL